MVLMKKLTDAIKSMAINMVIGQLGEKKSDIAKGIAAKIDIPFVKESDEIALAEGVLEVLNDTIKDLAK